MQNFRQMPKLQGVFCYVPNLVDKMINNDKNANG